MTLLMMFFSTFSERNLNPELREYIRHARSEIIKSRRKRDTRMIQDIQKSYSLFSLVDQEQTLLDSDLLGDSVIPSNVLS